MSSNLGKWEQSMVWACRKLFEGEVKKYKQICFQNVVLGLAGYSVVTGQARAESVDENISASSIAISVKAEDKHKLFYTKYEDNATILFTEDGVLGDCINIKDIPDWASVDLLMHSDLGMKKELESKGSLWKKFEELSRVIKRDFLPAYQEIFPDGILPSGTQLAEYLEKMRKHLYYVELKRKKDEQLRKEKKDKGSSESAFVDADCEPDSQKIVADISVKKKKSVDYDALIGDMESDPPHDYFPAEYLAFLTIGPMSKVPFPGWNVAGQQEKSIQPSGSQNKFSRKDLKEISEAAKEHQTAPKKAKREVETAPASLEIGRRIAEEMAAHNEILRRKERLQEMREAISLLKELGLPYGVQLQEYLKLLQSS